MKEKRLDHPILAFIAICMSVVACLFWANSAWLLTPLWAQLRLSELRGEVNKIPLVTNTVLVQQIEGMFPSGVYGCATVYMYELRGSNDLSLAEVLRTFKSALPPDVQSTVRESSSGASYVWKGNIDFHVSSFALEEDIMPFDRTRSDSAKRELRTLFVTGVTQPVYPDGYEERCH